MTKKGAIAPEIEAEQIADISTDVGNLLNLIDMVWMERDRPFLSSRT